MNTWSSHTAAPTAGASLKQAANPSAPGVADWLHTLGYALGAMIAAAVLGLVVLFAFTGFQQHPANGCEVKPANYRGVKK